MKEFEFLLPDGEKHKIEYDENTDKIKIVEDILKDWKIYINSCWAFYGKKDKNKINHEDKVKLMLNALAAFLDGSSYGEKNNSNEISLEYTKYEKKPIKYDLNNIVLGLQKDQDTYEFYNKRKAKKYKQSSTYKFKRIFTQDNIYKQEVYKLKNKDAYNDSEIDFFKNKFEFTDIQLEKWLEKPFKNIHNQNVFTIIKKTYKGWHGTIDNKKPYISKWCYVYSDGTFEFNGCKYQINVENVKQYKDIRKDKCLKEEKSWSMDNIFCVEQEDKVYFWDMNMGKISNKDVFKISLKDG